MAANIDPFVRHMVLADDIRPDPANPTKLILHGLIQTVRLVPPVTLPAVIDRMCVLLYLAGGRGTGVGQIVAVHADTNEPAFGSRPLRLTYPADPLRVVPVLFRMERCVVRRTGLYWVEFRHNNRPLAELSLLVE